jgi:hypothetical protein
MNWFKQNPFLGGLALLTGMATAAGLYFGSVQKAALTEQSDAYASNISKLNSLQSAKPFPDEANLQAAKAESELATAVLNGLASAVADQSAPRDNSLSPQQFQDKLSEAASAAIKQAQTAGIALPEDFYLGFAPYKAQPPAAAATPALGQQLASISNVLGLLLESRVREITAINRAPLPEESEAEKEQGGTPAGQLPDLLLAPFDVEFVADQANFRQALSSIASAQPMVLVRLVSVANSQPTAPAKEDPLAGGPPDTATADQPASIPVLFGQETLTVKLRLASVSVSAEKAKP